MNGELEAMTRALYGVHARQAPLNLIMQGVDGKDSTRIAGVFQSSLPGLTHPHPLHFGHEKRVLAGEHLLVLGDVIFRPHLIIASKHLQGTGIGGIYRTGFVDHAEWLKGEVLFDIKHT